MQFRKILVSSLSSFFYIGYLPFIPGTFGSLAGLVLFFAARNNPSACIILALVMTLLGFLVSGSAERIAGRKDPSHIVIDEVSGMLLSLLFLPYDIKLLLLGFLLFRILDTLKPFPAGALQDLPGSLGVMGDDIIAAVYTNAILQFVFRTASFKIW
ncbi:MAG TPA: phosphatidylglycerophosphatase A [Candidatus Margulisiibacteriota bacterium]|nr:phosphatidylglycerophosphatase A [Candidatus Margulisiibacteriota bacterium]